MKNYSALLLLPAGLLLAQCAKAPEVAPKVDYDQKSADIVQAVSPSVAGTWAMRRLAFKAQPVSYFRKDSVYEDFATIDIRPAAVARHSPADPRYADFTGLLHYKSKTYPVQFELTASPERLVHDQGPPALFLFEYNFPVGSHPTEEEEAFLQYLGLIGDNFTLEVAQGPPAMTWRGTSRGVDKIDLVKK
ncbi:hypothetical protein ACFQ48_09835 [Hymenobacter caeli]|uniref:Uncharacterized protein n=1 Tax=Hymenobacter caeli TaxID=2735894 RepID=A0ABX2FMH6_9BACT|nr:hypothetical protein [Hymenobacter caeli]NRT18373.1 hypothetical protein [Hymenobacter caeli]